MYFRTSCTSNSRRITTINLLDENSPEDADEGGSRLTTK